MVRLSYGPTTAGKDAHPVVRGSASQQSRKVRSRRTALLNSGNDQEEAGRC